MRGDLLLLLTVEELTCKNSLKYFTISFFLIYALSFREIIKFAICNSQLSLLYEIWCPKQYRVVTDFIKNSLGEKQKRSSIKVANLAEERRKTTQIAENNNFVRSTLQKYTQKYRNSHWRCSVKNGVLKIFGKIHKKTPVLESVL